MKAIHFSSVVLEGYTSKKDKSLSLRFSTPEMQDNEAVAVRALQGVVSDMLLQPQDEEFPTIVNVKGELDQKPLHVRLRGALWVLAQKMGKSNEESEQFYRHQMEKWIEATKERIQEYEK